MKISAILRIILFTVLTLILTGILLAGLGVGGLPPESSDYNTGSGDVAADQVTALKIDWAAGSVTIRTADTDRITFTEEGDFNSKQAMSYRVKDGVLHISFGTSQSYYFGITSPSKNLTVTVPENWVCESLEVDGAAIELGISGIAVDSMNLDGAAMELEFDGALQTLSCDGAACEMNIRSSTKVKSIDIDGASCQVELEIPAECGFRVETNGLSCSFRSDADYTTNDDTHTYGDGYCHITVDGLSCGITVKHSA